MKKDNSQIIYTSHESDFLGERTQDSMNEASLNAGFSHVQKANDMSIGENLIQNKEQQLHFSFYNKISEEIYRKSAVLIFGPVNAGRNETIQLKQIITSIV